ncbi:MAG: DUF559 domain-containing protein [Mycobacterium sp.]
MDSPFLGTEAVAAGAVPKHALRTRFRPLYPGVYLPRGVTPDFRQRAEGAWLWSNRDGILFGLTAARLHGAKWIDDTAPIEVASSSNGRPPPGIRVFRGELGADGRDIRAGLPVTSLLRTAFDIGRRGRIADAVARLDALGNASAFPPEALADFADSQRGHRGVRRLRAALALHDPGAQSPQETRLRLLVLGAGFPRPRTQIPVHVGGRAKYYLDLGWEDRKLAAEYDGDQHRADRSQFTKDITRLEELADLGWTVIRVAAGMRRDETLARIRRAWDAPSVR